MTAITTFFDKSKSSPFGMILIGVLSIAALIASARIQAPMIPVPITFQTVVVLMLPALLGGRMALTILGIYFAAGAAGFPVFAMAAGAIPGPAYFMGPTGGYLAGFVAAAMMVGALYPRKSSWSLTELFALMLAGHAVILACGAIWLAFGVPSLGLTAALASGVAPFLIGSILKAGIAAALLVPAQKKA